MPEASTLRYYVPYIKVSRRPYLRYYVPYIYIYYCAVALPAGIPYLIYTLVYITVREPLYGPAATSILLAIGSSRTLQAGGAAGMIPAALPPWVNAACLKPRLNPPYTTGRTPAVHLRGSSTSVQFGINY